MKRSMTALAIAVVSSIVVLGATPAQATFPAKNGRIAFYADLSDGSEIYSIGRTGSSLQRLTRLDGDAHSPDWSSDGTRIVFSSGHPSGRTRCSIEIMNADGSGMVDLTGARRGCEKDPSFTPDGQRIVFVRQPCSTCRAAIWSMNLRGADRRKIVAAPRASGKFVSPEDPSLSPDGTTLAFVGELNQERAIRALYTVKMSGSNLDRIVPFSFHLGTVTDWSPDGDRIVFTEYQTGPGNTVTILPDGSGLLRVTHYTGDTGAGGASYSPDGRWIVFRLQDNAKNRFALWKMRPDGSHATRIRRLRFNFGSIHWGPRSG